MIKRYPKVEYPATLPNGSVNKVLYSDYQREIELRRKQIREDGSFTFLVEVYPLMHGAREHTPCLDLPFDTEGWGNCLAVDGKVTEEMIDAINKERFVRKGAYIYELGKRDEKKIDCFVAMFKDEYLRYRENAKQRAAESEQLSKERSLFARERGCTILQYQMFQMFWFFNGHTPKEEWDRQMDYVMAADPRDFFSRCSMYMNKLITKNQVFTSEPPTILNDDDHRSLIEHKDSNKPH